MAKEISCRDGGYDCDFVVRDENEDDLVTFVQEHPEQAHGTEMSRSGFEGARFTI
jgi:predicted small metal-binding protein